MLIRYAYTLIRLYAYTLIRYAYTLIRYTNHVFIFEFFGE